MKSLFILLLILPLLSFNIESDKELFIGKWEGELNGAFGHFIFDEEGYVLFGEVGEVGGGKNFDINGQTGSVTYETPESVDDYIHLDIIITMHDDGDQTRLLCIVKFIDDNTMDFAIQYDIGSSNRPADFESGNYARLVRAVEKID